MNTKPKAYSYIRFSTPEQEKGDSLRRQEKEAEDYARENGLSLDESQKFKDLGKSGYKGFNRIDGALKNFIDLVDRGEIPHGSFLIVEHLDRLTREKVSVALRLFMDLLDKGIRIVTLNDHQKYDKSSIDKNPIQLIISITLMSSAHEESLKKSKRIRASREEKRKKLQNQEIKIYTAKCPSWVMLSKDKTKFEIIPEASKAIKLIFKKRLEGKGSYKIARELNLDTTVWKPISSRNKSGGWRESYINKILRNRRVIGEFQPHELKSETIKEYGKEVERTIRVPVDDPIKNYFPKVIDEGTFFRVQEIINLNAKLPGNAGGGNKDKGSNLFSHVVKCGICGSTMQYLQKGNNNWAYLVCDSVRRQNKVLIEIRNGQKYPKMMIPKKFRPRNLPDVDIKTVEMVCTSKSVRYDEFEKIFFENFEELDIGTLIPGDDETTKLKKEKENTISGNKFKMDKLEKRIKNLVNAISDTDDKANQKMYDQEVTEKRIAKEKLLAENQKLEEEKKELVEQRQGLKKQKESIKEIYSFLESAIDQKERINRRFQLRQEIKNMIEWVMIYTLQEEYKEYEEIEPGIIKYMASKSIDRIRIKFKGSIHIRVIYLKSSGEIIEPVEI